MFSMINIILAVVVALYIGLDIMRKRTLDVREIILNAIKIVLLAVAIKGLWEAVNLVLDPSFMDSLLNRTVDKVTANAIVSGIALFTFLSIDKIYKVGADIVGDIGNDVIALVGTIAKKSDKSDASSSKTSLS